jgi:CTP synthase
MLLCRSERTLPFEVKEKIALFCDVDVESVITASDVSSVYEVPLTFAEQGVDETVLKLLKMSSPHDRDLGRWTGMLERMQNPEDEVEIGLVGKYVEYEDSYKSLKEALLHGALAHRLKVNIHWIESEALAWPDCAEALERYDGILVPGGFGKRGVEGMINAIRYARESRTPYFGICLGMQTMVIEFARNVCGLQRANSTEFDPATPNRVIYKLRELKGVDELGGTMRLGAYPCLLADGSHAKAAYGQSQISERHRHRYEFNREFEAALKEGGLRLTGQTPDGVYVEICELPDHPWFLGCQFHPEFKSKPMEPHPLFADFIGAAYKNRKARSRVRPVRAERFSHAD